MAARVSSLTYRGEHQDVAAADVAVARIMDVRDVRRSSETDVVSTADFWSLGRLRHTRQAEKSRRGYRPAGRGLVDAAANGGATLHEADAPPGETRRPQLKPRRRRSSSSRSSRRRSLGVLPSIAEHPEEVGWLELGAILTSEIVNIVGSRSTGIAGSCSSDEDFTDDSPFSAGSPSSPTSSSSSGSSQRRKAPERLGIPTEVAKTGSVTPVWDKGQQYEYLDADEPDSLEVELDIDITHVDSPLPLFPSEGSKPAASTRSPWSAAGIWRSEGSASESSGSSSPRKSSRKSRAVSVLGHFTGATERRSCMDSWVAKVLHIRQRAW